MMPAADATIRYHPQRVLFTLTNCRPSLATRILVGFTHLESMRYKMKHENTVLKSKLTHFFPKRYDIIKHDKIVICSLWTIDYDYGEGMTFKKSLLKKQINYCAIDLRGVTYFLITVYRSNHTPKLYFQFRLICVTEQTNLDQR